MLSRLQTKAEAIVFTKTTGHTSPKVFMTKSPVTNDEPNTSASTTRINWSDLGDDDTIELNQSVHDANANITASPGTTTTSANGNKNITATVTNTACSGCATFATLINELTIRITSLEKIIDTRLVVVTVY